MWYLQQGVGWLWVKQHKPTTEDLHLKIQCLSLNVFLSISSKQMASIWKFFSPVLQRIFSLAIFFFCKNESWHRSAPYPPYFCMEHRCALVLFSYQAPTLCKALIVTTQLADFSTWKELRDCLEESFVSVGFQYSLGHLKARDQELCLCASSSFWHNNRHPKWSLISSSILHILFQSINMLGSLCAQTRHKQFRQQML